MLICQTRLRTRLIVSLGLLFILGFSALGFYLYDTRDELRRLSLFLQAEEIAASFQPGHDINTLPTHYAGGELSYTLYTPEHEVAQVSSQLSQPRRLRPASAADETRLWHWPRRSGLVVTVPIPLANGYTLVVAKQDTRERDLIGQLLQAQMWRSLLMLIPFFVLASLLIGVLVTWTLRPLKKSAALAKQIGPEHPDLRLPINTLPLEIQPLATAINTSLDRMHQAYHNEQQLLADTAHQLRTPLTVLKLRLLAAQQSPLIPWSALQQDVLHLQRLVTQLLSFARHQNAQPMATDTLNMAKLCRQCIADILPLYEQQQRLIRLELKANCELTGSGVELQEALSNLLDNALQHGQGEVCVSLDATDTHCILEISDQGPTPALHPIAHNHAHLFKRFSATDANKTGAGLGLAIVQSIVHRAAGTIYFANTPATTLHIQLPKVTSGSPSL